MPTLPRSRSSSRVVMTTGWKRNVTQWSPTQTWWIPPGGQTGRALLYGEPASAAVVHMKLSNRFSAFTWKISNLYAWQHDLVLFSFLKLAGEESQRTLGGHTEIICDITAGNVRPYEINQVETAMDTVLQGWEASIIGSRNQDWLGVSKNGEDRKKLLCGEHGSCPGEMWRKLISNVGEVVRGSRTGTQRDVSAALR